MSDTVICPNCKFEIEVTEVLSAQLRAQLQKEFEADIRKKESAIAERENDVVRAQAAVAAAEQDIDRRVTEQLGKERMQLSADALTAAREQVTLELRDKDEQLAEAATKLKTAQEAELALRKDRRELEEQKQSFELTVTRRLDEERTKIRDTAKQEAADERALKDAEKDKLIADLNSKIDDLKRKVEQGSQQTQGEVLELELETILQRQFPFDTMTPVPKGIHGGDVVHLVHDSNGAECGTILWETKRTKTWSDSWLSKLRDDQRAAKAQFAVLVSIEMPKGVSTFSSIEGVWVASWPCVIGIGMALRACLIEIATANRSQDGKQGKMELMYNYLSGSEFRHRVEGIVEAFMTLRNDLEAEKRSIQRIWAKREKQLDRAVANTVGMHGDVSGLIGAGLPAIEQLNLPAPPAQDGSESDNSSDE